MEAWEEHREEVENKRKALIITAIINIAVLIAIYFMVVWSQPVPPIPQYGLELNLGFTETGSGNTQTQVPPAVSEIQNTEAPAPGEPAPEMNETAVPVATPETRTTQPTPTESKKAPENQSKVLSPIKGAEKPLETVKESSVPEKSSVPVTKPAEEKAEET